MFFADPTAAFRNLCTALRPAGRLAFVCWQALDRNPWAAVPLAAVARHVSLPAPSPPGTPGPFAFADAARLAERLADAGFRSIVCDPVCEPTLIGGGASLDDTVALLLQLGPAASAVREAGGARTAEVAAALRDAIAPIPAPTAEDGRRPVSSRPSGVIERPPAGGYKRRMASRRSVLRALLGAVALGAFAPVGLVTADEAAVRRYVVGISGMT